MTFARLTPEALLARLERPEPLLLLDVRRAGSLQKQPFGISGAIPVVLNPSGSELPDIERDPYSPACSWNAEWLWYQ